MFLHNFSLKPYNTFSIYATAKDFASFSSQDKLTEILHHSSYSCNDTLILGGGSNLLFTRNYDGLVLKNEIKGIETVKEDDSHIWVKAGAGESWHGFVLHCIANHLAGVENLSLIPGCVGASPMQNIGAYGVEIKDVFHSLEAYHLQDHTSVTFGLQDCGFGYRESVFKNKYKNQFAITQVIFKLRKQPLYNTSYGAIEQELEKMGIQQISIKAISDAVINIRRSKLPDPAITGNAGSFFKNPTIPTAQYDALQEKFSGIVGYPVKIAGDSPSSVAGSAPATKVAAGWLIEQCGWKGYRSGDAGVHPRQALVLVNYGHATGQAIYDLSTRIKETVLEKFGIELEREVNII